MPCITMGQIVRLCDPLSSDELFPTKQKKIIRDYRLVANTGIVLSKIVTRQNRIEHYAAVINRKRKFISVISNIEYQSMDLHSARALAI